jgi:pyrroloquinoline quinone (PQQ) biosynthesis protein C
LRRTVEQHALLGHSFLALASACELTPMVVTAWALQDRHVAYAFPRIIAAIIAALPARDVNTVVARMPMLRNLWEEAGEGDPAAAHSTLMDSLLLSIGVPIEKLYDEPSDSSAAFIDYQLRLTADDPIAAIAVFCYANEYLALREYPPLQRAVVSCFPHADVRFFEANWEADGRHTELAEDCLYAFATPAHLRRMETAVVQALNIRQRLYDDLLALLPSNAASAPWTVGR